MITGFNTDIEFQGVTYHVQTEDKGVDTPLILSLVYDRGTILASKRSPYDDLLTGTFDEQVLAARLQKQHKLICAAVRAGRIEDLKRMTVKDSASKNRKSVAQKELKSENGKAAEKPEIKKEASTPPQVFKKTLPAVEQNEANIQLDLPATQKGEKTIAKAPQTKEEFVLDVPISIIEDPIIEAVQIFEEELILPTEAVEIISDESEINRVIDNTLKIEIIGDHTFKGGERKTISILVYRGTRKNVLSGAHIMVKVLGSAFRPLIFHSKTDQSGIAFVHLQLPRFRTGRAAILIRAMSEGEETDLRRVIQQD